MAVKKTWRDRSGGMARSRRPRQPVGDRARRARRRSCRPWPARVAAARSPWASNARIAAGLARAAVGRIVRRAAHRRCKRARDGAGRLRCRCGPAARPARASSLVISSGVFGDRDAAGDGGQRAAQLGGASARASARDLLVLRGAQQRLRPRPRPAPRSPGATPASSGKRFSRAWQKAWMVRMLMPPGASSTRANSRRATTALARRGTGRSISSCDLLVERGIVGQRPAAELAAPAGCASPPPPPW